MRMQFGGNARYSHTGFRWVFSGADEIRRFLPELDDELSTPQVAGIPSFLHRGRP